jgi:hypothetical protein
MIAVAPAPGREENYCSNLRIRHVQAQYPEDKT